MHVEQSVPANLQVEQSALATQELVAHKLLFCDPLS